MRHDNVSYITVIFLLFQIEVVVLDFGEAGTEIDHMLINCVSNFIC